MLALGIVRQRTDKQYAVQPAVFIGYLELSLLDVSHLSSELPLARTAPDNAEKLGVVLPTFLRSRSSCVVVMYDLLKAD